VELSNLNRQILYRTQDIGKKKVERCVGTLQDLNPSISIEAINEKVTEHNIVDLCKDFDFVVEGGDSPAGRNLVNDYCLTSSKPFTHASAQFNYGYVFSVVPMLKTACFACFFPGDYSRREHTGPVPVSVLATSIAGSLGAAEVLKWFMGYKESMFLNKRLCFSSLLLSGEFTVEMQERNLHCQVCSHHYLNN
jgi:adenylyltransferase/sulfurtransferase